MRRLLMRLIALVRRRHLDAELSEEIAAHLDEAIAENIASGMSPYDARRAALLEFGGTMQTMEAYRDREGWPLIEHVIQDLGYAIRLLAKRPILLVTTTLSIGFGVGLNVAVFSVLRAVLFEPGLTASAPEQLFVVGPGLSYPNYADIRATDAFADLAAMQASTLTYRTADVTTTIGARVVSDNYFEVLGLRAVVGRTFGVSDGPGTIKDPNTVVVSYAFWQRLGGDQSVVGRTIYLNGWPYEIAGVLPRNVYSLVAPMVAPSVYVQLGSRVNRGLDARQAAQFDAIGRLRAGATREQAAAALGVITRDLERRYPAANEAVSRTITLAPFGGIVERLPAGGGRIAYTLAGALYAVVGLVLLVACANVAGLLLARAAERAREVSIRIALGATRWRLAQQFIAESLVVAALGCAAGVALWIAVTSLLPRLSPIVSAGIDLIPPPLSLTQCAVLVLVVTVACGLGPAVTVNQLAPAAGRMPSIGRRRFAHWAFAQWLVAAQVAVSFIVLAGACALLFSVLNQQLANPGFDVAHTLSVETRWPTTSNGPNFFTLRDALSNVPGVESVTSGGLPVGLIGFSRVHDEPDNRPLSVEIDRVGPRYLETMGIRLLRGRDFTDADMRRAAGVPVPIVVGDTFARRYFGSLDVIDHMLSLPRDSENGTEASHLQIVGVSEDSAVQVFGGDRVPLLYIPETSPRLAIRVVGDASAASRSVARAIATLEPAAAVDIAPTAKRLSAVLLPVRVATAFLTVLGAIALLLAMTGLYGMVSYAANHRRLEIALRIALGASWLGAVRLLLRDAIRTIGAASIAGGLLSVLLIRAVWPLLAGQQNATAAIVLVLVFFVILVVGIAASLRPTLSVAMADPMVVLRQD